MVERWNKMQHVFEFQRFLCRIKRTHKPEGSSRKNETKSIQLLQLLCRGIQKKTFNIQNKLYSKLNCLKC